MASRTLLAGGAAGDFDFCSARSTSDFNSVMLNGLLEVADDDVERLGAAASQRLLGIGGGFDLAVRFRQQLLHEPTGAWIVVEYEDA
jgi:hypothetical protein